VVVLRDGKSVAELTGEDIEQDAIIHAMAEGAAPSLAPPPAPEGGA
jgi:ABC-type sugar transport system ATPase subunit